MFVCVGLGIYLEGGSIRTFISLTPAMFVFAPVFIYMLFSHGLSGFPDFLRRAAALKLNEKDCASIDVAVTLGFLFATMGTISGMAHVFAYLDDPSTIGAGVSAAMMSAFYGVIPAILLLPLKPLKSEKSAQARSTRSSHIKKAAGFMVATLFLSAGSLMTVLYVVK